MSYSKTTIEEEYSYGDHEYENDVLSLCDLPMYNSESTDNDDSFKESSDHSKSFSDDQDSLFEFFSEEWNLPTKSPVFLKDDNKNILEKRSTTLIPWNSDSGSYSRSKKHVSASKENVVLPKVHVYTTPLKSKLLLVLFGLPPPKIPTDQMVFMSDIRTRQSRRAPTTFFPAKGCEEVAPVRRSSKGLWRFVRAASCFGGQSHTKS